MADLNVLAVVGRLVREPELKYNDKGRPICRATIANNVGFGKSASTNYIRIVAAGQAGEFLAKYGEKGRPVSVNGELRLSSVKNPDGSYNNSCTVFVKDLSLLSNGGSKAEPGDDTAKFSDKVSQAYEEAYQINATQPDNITTAAEPKEDIPF